MGKLEPFDGKRTKWGGLWYHQHNRCFSSESFDLADIKKFKGRVRIVVRKNRFYDNGKNGRPNYVFMIVDSKNEKWKEFIIEDDIDDDETQTDEGTWEPTYDPIWLGVETGYKCSECGHRTDEKHRYCPCCGADME